MTDFIKKAAGIQKGSDNPLKNKVGKLTKEQVKDHPCRTGQRGVHRRPSHRLERQCTFVDRVDFESRACRALAA
jgi:hypothetical protein